MPRMEVTSSREATVPNHPSMGRQVRLTSKGNEGKRAWLDVSKGETSQMIYVLVEDATGRPLRATRVMKSSVAEMHVTPTSRFQAMLQQKPSIESAILSLAKKIAKCKVAGDDELKDFIGKKIDEHLAKLHAKGNMDWTEIRFGQDAEHEERVRVAQEEAAEARRALLAVEERAAQEAQAARVAEERAAREAQQRAQLEEDMQRMASEFSRFQVEFVRERQRAQQAEARIAQAEEELDRIHRNEAEDMFDDLTVEVDSENQEAHTFRANS